MPMAFGTRRPAILIPATADTWPEDRRRAVILHELAHVARYDCLTQIARVRGLHDVLVPSSGVVGCATSAHRARACVRRPRDRGGRSGSRVRRPSARDRVQPGQPPRAGPRGQHGASATARRSHAGRARRRRETEACQRCGCVRRGGRHRGRHCCFRWRRHARASSRRSDADDCAYVDRAVARPGVRRP